MPDLLDHFANQEAAARRALFDAKALDHCRRHDTTIRIGDDEAERKAYAFATVTAKREGNVEDLTELREAIAAVLVEAAEGSCPTCDKVMLDD